MKENNIIRKFNIILPEKNPFEIDENFCSIRRSWDWFFEMNSYEVKKQTLKEFDKLIESVVNNRDIIEEIFSSTMIDLANIGVAIDQQLHSFLISQYSRMIKTSKIIQDLIIEGSYIESKALLRTNLERGILINFFLFNPEKLNLYYEFKKKNKRTREFSVKNMVAKIGKDYRFYSYLCKFVHAENHLNDLMDLEIKGDTWNFLRPYNYFEGGESVALLAEDSNVLIEAFYYIRRYIEAILPKNAPKELKSILEKTKSVKLIKLKDEKYENTN